MRNQIDTLEIVGLRSKIAARDHTIARLEAELKDKREALALEILAHEKTAAALRSEREAMAAQRKPRY